MSFNKALYVELMNLTGFVLQTKNIMVSSYARTKEASRAKYISILNIIQGEVDPTQVMTIFYLLLSRNFYSAWFSICFESYHSDEVMVDTRFSRSLHFKMIGYSP